MPWLPRFVYWRAILIPVNNDRKKITVTARDVILSYNCMFSLWIFAFEDRRSLVLSSHTDSLDCSLETFY